MDSFDISHGSIINSVFRDSTHFSDLVSILSTLLNFLLGFAAITAIIALIINITKWGRASDSPVRREEAKHNIAVCGVCLAVLGGFSAVYILILLLAF